MPEIRGCQFPEELFYDEGCNLWFEPLADGEHKIGITQYGAVLVGDIYMFNPKRVGRLVEIEEAFALIEVAKTILPMRVPLELTITAINDEVQEKPFLINTEAYKSWLIKAKFTDPALAASIMFSGQALLEKANSAMDLNRFNSLEEFESERSRS
jgi:glycine cleavage system H protein